MSEVLHFLKEHFDSYRWFKEKYDMISYGHIKRNDSVRYLGDRSNRVCRYCRKNENETTFKNIAHAFPELIGNNALFDLYECDRCNTHFAKTADDDFAKWTLPFRTVSAIKGKKGLPTYKAKDNSLRLDVELRINDDNERRHRFLNFQKLTDDGAFEIDFDENRIETTLESQPYVPMGVYKCLLKMALSVLAESETIPSEIMDWLLEERHGEYEPPFSPLLVFRKIFCGPSSNDFFEFKMFRRKQGFVDCPLYLFTLLYTNTLYQIMLPLIGESEAEQEDLNFNYTINVLPSITDSVEWQEQYGRNMEEVFDMSSTEKQTKNLKETIAIKFENIIQTKAGEKGA